MGPKDKRRVLILIVDDDALTIRQYKREIERRIAGAFRAGDAITTIAHTSPTNALTTLRQSEAEYRAVLLLSDGDMPDVPGPKLVEAVGKIFGERLKLKLLVSGTLTDEDRRQAAEGAFQAFEKPLPNPVLHKLIDEFLALTAE